jgi:hypothetical protein
MADISAGQSATEGAVVQGTKQKQVHAWNRYQSCLFTIGLHKDIYLDGLNQGQCIRILSAFTHFIRESRFNPTTTRILKSESLRSTLDCVAQTYRLANRPDPCLDADGRIAFLLQRQLRGYSTVDPGEKQQIAITASILRTFHRTAFSQFDKAICELFTGAFFLATQSCKYVKVSGPRKTKLLALKNIHFYKGCTEIKHTDPFLNLAECISITFELQKRDTKKTLLPDTGQKIASFARENLGKNHSTDICLPLLFPHYDSKLLPTFRWNPTPFLRSSATKQTKASNQHSGQREIRIHCQPNRPSFSKKRSRHGDVLSWSTSFHQHASGKMVERRIPSLHQKTG